MKPEIARRRYAKALTEYNQAVRKAYPPGTIIKCFKGKAVRTLEVTDHNNADWVAPRLWVRNPETGKEYWLDAYYFLAKDSK